MAFIPSSGSVVTFQSDPTKLVGTVSIVGSPTQLAGSILAVNFPSPSTISYQLAGSILAVSGSFSSTPQSSINALQIAGSVLAVNMPSPSVIALQLAGSVLAVSGTFSATPQGSITIMQSAGSVLGVRTDNASVIAVLSNSSVTALQGTNPWQVNVPSPSTIAYQAAGSIMAVSGSFTANPQSSIIATQIAGSVLAVNMPSPSIIAYQAAGSIMAVSATVNTGNSSVQLLNSTAVIGSVAALQSGTWNISQVSGANVNQWNGNTVATGTGPSTIGTLRAVLVTDQSSIATTVVNMPSPSVIAYQAAGSVMAVSGTFSSTPQGSIIALQLAGSVLAVSGNFSSGNTSVQLLGGVATIGSVVALQGGVWATSMVGGPIQVNSILGTYLEKSASVPSVIGFPMLFRSNSTTSVLTTPSPTDPLPIQGSVTALQGTNPWIINMPSPSVVIITPAGSVQGVRTDNASVIAVVSNSSVLTFQGTIPWVIQSIVGTFANNTAFTNNDKGLGVLGIRNDTVASIVNADKQYGQWAMDSAGRNLVIPFAPGEASIIANASVVNGGDSGSVVVFAAAGTGLRNYITDFEISNTGSVATLITFTEGGGSIIGRTIAPAGGGSNMPGMSTPMRNQKANQPINMVTATASSVVYVAAWGYKAP